MSGAADPSSALRDLVARLARPEVLGHPVERVQVLETHISCVLLTGAWAYKFKKPVALGFLDFSTLAARRDACFEELRLNRRLAPDLYVDVLPVTGSPEHPELSGAGAAFEYAVRMREFPQAALGTSVLAAGDLAAGMVEDLGSRLGAFHAAMPAAPPDSGWGSPSAVAEAVTAACEQVEGPAVTAAAAGLLATLRPALDAALTLAAPRVAARRLAGHVREGHGDLHLGNLVLLGDRLVPFDCIEFSAALRWGDVAADIAFPCMDLSARGRPDLSTCLLGAWLDATGDVDALGVLPLYCAYRALVRAKVAALRAAGGADARDPAGEVERYLRAAQAALAPREPPLLILMHGLSGSGKSRVAHDLAVALDAVRLRADIERKRLAGLPASADSRAAGIDLYTPAMHRRTYARLLEMAGVALRADHSVVVDATFLRSSERAAFMALAAARGWQARIVAVEAPYAVLEDRIRRRAIGGDASEADCAVLALQAGRREPLDAAERAVTLVLDNAGTLPDCAALAMGLRARQTPAGT